MIPAKLRPPRDKFDLAAVAALGGADANTLRPLLPELLEWLQDANWPVARPLAELLRPHQQAFDRELAAILRGDDEEWKQTLFSCLLDHRAAAVLHEAELIARCPTGGECEAGTDAAARAFLNRRAAPDQVPEKQP